MSNLFYDEDLQGGVTNLVFKYADKPTVFFQCQIRLHYKDDPFSKCQ
uniref:ZP domain-containing protein n=1 Tax=Romanomermis culicivorax TaxID=13658 RepID=A0A915IDB1_ROMCU